jgi:hypothetical protein
MEEWDAGTMVVTNTKAFILIRCHCEPEGRGNLGYVQIASSFHTSQ